MAPPPYINFQFFGRPPSFLMQPYQQPGTAEKQPRQRTEQGIRHDSPTESRRPPPQANPQVLGEKRTRRSEMRESSSQGTTPGPADQLQPPRSTRVDRPSAFTTNSDGGLRFVTVNNPGAQPNKDEMRANRQHVMYNFIGRSRKSGSKDVRAKSQTGSKKRRKLSPMRIPGTSVNLQAPGIMFDKSSLTPATSAYSTASSHTGDSDGDSGKSTVLAPRSAALTPQRTNPVTSEPRFLQPGSPPSRSADNPEQAEDELLVQRPTTRAYEVADLNSIPFSRGLGGRINAFNTWPTFDDLSINMEQLKHMCILRFGSQAMSTLWVPTLLRARHSFLSTICISSAHNEIMEKAAGIEPPVRVRQETERLTIRGKVMAMINHSLDDPAQRTSDTTMVAVLHVLMSEIIDCDSTAISIHIAGLNRMVQMRRGLDRLGIRGQLAMVSTSMVLLVAALHETVPEQMYLEHARRQPGEPISNARPVPENPVFCGPRYETLSRRLGSRSRFLQLLELLRVLTRSWTRLNCRADVSKLRERIFAFEPLLPNEREPVGWMYEAVRLTGRLYARALTERVPFSEICASERSQKPFAYLKIMRALQRTNFGDCWGHLAGVLLWIALIAGATSNVGARAGDLEAGLARKWFAAVATQCCVVLNFEHPAAVLGTLRQVVEIQQALREFSGLRASV